MSDVITLQVSDEFHGKRLDAILGGMIDSHSRSALRTLIDEGKVLVDGKVLNKASIKLNAGQNIEVHMDEPESLEAVPEDIPLNIVYQDDDLIVINKPINFVVHPGAGVKNGTVMNAMLYHFPQTAVLARAGIVHRLDKDTSGLMVIALSQTAQHHLIKAISKHLVVREYEAIVEGELTAGGTVDAPIGRDLHNRTRMAVMPDGMGREAVTHYRVMERYRAHTRLKLRLETGRTHQIRVHMASLHHPLLGDTQYGGRRIKHIAGASAELDQALNAYRHQALHASHIEFEHPVTGETLSFDAPIPEEMKNLMDLLREDYKLNGLY
ncbi:MULTISPECIES: 23S rRNA pseudouridine(1911/1915/1917) synthase RluD [unclassified Anaerobiospirillum]|uniref:23S rRNA pseudouridine(1911/1915/1917) synthase RluD n=1 Tax=unclassified Anaerobiospirillum TaxID=2647410 RepID=UPI001FF24B1B|nr:MULTISPECIES: 23S rRNA pseudouridine(1911/1915/1917) synthase RluD [unclassified Anaerobiospirillum]MCK0527322.1 23S rRNA pseudouridine(1911/1915/1917) synthase RluD [Anaerobiospirillum sp. NML120449]MCK0536008.1 23S rRNA pseudouridine(1911/1915/1917) synthase RluD [Anaerobiospirillum sp. NML120511]MCK0541167.1 23S rRNA pseudouridine(1911/1915/1917) synthase RluD [Anaerobiospirillum sp. NML02-A-032]